MERVIKILDKEIKLSSGLFAKNAHGSIVVSSGGTNILCTVCVGKPNELTSFANLRVSYHETSHACGKIPGGYFRRDGKPTEREVLVSRIIDRSLRPMIPDDYLFEIQLTCTLLAYDKKHDPASIVVNGASAALLAAGVPLISPVAAARICYCVNEDKLIINPLIRNQHSVLIYGMVAINKSGITMLELQCNSALYEQVVSAIKEANDVIIPAIEGINDFANTGISGLFNPNEYTDLISHIKKQISERSDKLEQLLEIKDKMSLSAKIKDLTQEINANFEKDYQDLIQGFIKETLNDLTKAFIAKQKKRLDGREYNQLRELSAKIDVFNGQPGMSVLFSRGGTQVLASTSFGTGSDEQSIEYLGQYIKEKFILHYNFPSFSVGEIRKSGPPGRREIGHGALAKKALFSVMPKSYSYTVRSVADVLESDGSSSMATICSVSMSLMSAGVQITDHVSGVAMGALSNIKGYDEDIIITDISGSEDSFSDMDCKIAGTRKGITAIQMDIKSESISIDTIEKAINQSHDARMKILDFMYEQVSSPKDIISDLPKTEKITIPSAKIKNLIGKKGENINSICHEANVKIDISQNGIVEISSKDGDIELAKNLIFNSLNPLKINSIYKGKVVSYDGETLGISFLNDTAKGICLYQGDQYKKGSSISIKLKKISKKETPHQLEIANSK